MSHVELPMGRDFTVRDIGRFIWRDRGVPIAALIVLVLLVSVSMWLTSPKYRAAMVVAPANTGLATSSGAASGALEGVSALLGRKQDITPFDIYLKYYGSIELADMLEKRHGLMKIVFAKQWDQVGHRWRPRRGIASTSLGLLRGLYGVPSSNIPTLGDLRDYLAKAIVISPGDGQEMQSISATAPDPQFARNLILWAHDASETLTKARVQKSTAANVAYLQQKLSVVTQSDQHQSLAGLLTAQEHQMMMLQSWNGYASDIIEAPDVSASPVAPNPPLMLTLAIIGGIVLGAFASVVRMFAGYSPMNVLSLWQKSRRRFFG